MQIKLKDFIFYKYEIENWKNVKVKLLETCEKCNEHFLDNVITNWNTNEGQKKFIKNKISNILQHQIDFFKKENNLFFYKLDSAWFQKYKKGMNHNIHNHGYGGYSSIVYINYNSKYHYPTTFIDKHLDNLNIYSLLNNISIPIEYFETKEIKKVKGILNIKRYMKLNNFIQLKNIVLKNKL
jgi:hypothetical protein